MTNNRKDSDRRLADLSITPDADVWGPHDPGSCPDCHTQADPIIVGAGQRITARYQVCKGKTLDFALMHDHLVGDEWKSVVRVDCKHDEVHAHWFDADGQEFSRDVLQPITCQDDVESGHKRAEEIVFDAWEANLERCSRGH